MLKDLIELRNQLSEAAEAGDSKRTLRLAKKYTRLYKQCYPNS